ncbi:MULTISPECIES: Nramp family divalent metal transporter [unclassified Solwaraspora]|uniref:Nramp family divalent metal transporter n=1 Tax=unclassified Solwaraspora TaxID=2627926 RepID=UPI00248CD26A|nr:MULTISPECIES: Nramp family divalent metal transporter [unclassified Solwaraspora]WBB98039.1 Nramp family divalent metal transporter [Solwaraspora sp. WMMA2059]WBC23407.1 Nramp family divalent metal transporter [Solwaraspora sp. WMMA2080]WJK34511.1 Nramp family divalent metal transporter [Solwaraspora sp. WMMA2065]
MSQVTEAAPQRSTGVPEPPTGWRRFRYIGPGVLWALAALATGELLFTPRVGAQYGYSLMWALVAVLVLKLFVTREIGRYSVVTGRRLLTGLAGLPGPAGWAIWLILVPQLVVGIAAIAGIASAAGSALALAVPGPIQAWTGAVLAAAAGLVLVGHYTGVEWVSRVLGIALALGAVVAAIQVGPDLTEAAAGFVPVPPDDLQVAEILPWLGFLSNGAAGLMWYSYWITAKGIGHAGVAAADRRDPRDLDSHQIDRVRGWLRTMTLDSTFAVVGVALITVAFLILGAELLRPEGIVPAEADVARDLTRLFSEVFGSVGFWLMVVGLVSAFWTATLTNIDGWQRLYTDGVRRVLPERLTEHSLARPAVISRTAVVVWLATLPYAVFLIFGNPVALLTLAGSIEAVHIPLVAGLVLWLNRRTMPRALRAGWAATALVVAAVVFFTWFALYYLWQQFAG